MNVDKLVLIYDLWLVFKKRISWLASSQSYLSANIIEKSRPGDEPQSVMKAT